MAVPKLNLRAKQTQKAEFSDVSLTYDIVKNGSIQLLDDTPRQRFGAESYPEYAQKLEGYTPINTVAAATGVGNGGIMYVSPDVSVTNRSRIIYAFNNIVYLYDIVNDTQFQLRDIGTDDSFTIGFLSGVQTKANAYFVIGDSTSGTALYKYQGSSSGSNTVYAAMAGSITAYAEPTGSITAYARASGTTTTVTSAAHGLSNSESITISGTTNYDGTYTVASVTTDTFVITIVFSSDEASGTWVSNDKTTVTDASHGLVDADSITITSTAAYNGTYTVEDISTNTFVIDKPFVTDEGTGSWSNSAKVTVTSSSHGLANGNSITIAGTTSYNGTFTILNATTNTYNITDTFVADDATGTWTSETMSKVTATGMNAGRIISKLDDRIMVAGTGENNGTVQYSNLDSTATFTNFTNGTGTTDPGLLSGSLDSVTALEYINGIGVVFEEGRVTSHTVGKLDDYGTGLVKDTVTLNENRTISGTGTHSKKGAAAANDRIYFADSNSIQEFNPVTGELNSITDSFQPLLQDFDFTDSSIMYDEKRNLLYITMASVAGIGSDRIFVYSFDTESWGMDEGKRVNQLFYDPIAEKVFGLSSSVNGQVDELYDGGYTNDDSVNELSCETIMNDMGNRMRKKRYVSSSFIIGAVNTAQSFTFEFFINNNSEAAETVTKTISDILTSGGSSTSAWGGSTWAGGSPGSTQLGFLHYEHTFFVPDFARISVRVTEESSLRSAVGEAVIRFSESTDTINDFS